MRVYIPTWQFSEVQEAWLVFIRSDLGCGVSPMDGFKVFPPMFL